MNNVLNKMIEQLSEEDKVVFSSLADKLKRLEGDISKLSKDELSLISEMENKYADKLATFKQEIKSQQDSGDFLSSGFAKHCRQILARDLKSQFPNEEDAIKFAYQNKWIPQEFKDPKSAEQFFDRYEKDISEANQWREDVVGIESDKIMAVGMTWFMVIFQLHQR